VVRRAKLECSAKRAGLLPRPPNNVYGWNSEISDAILCELKDLTGLAAKVCR
jgi:hypothetical protein